MISVTHIQLLTSQTKHTKGNAELFHTYFGYGFLSKDKLVFKNSENIDDIDFEKKECVIFGKGSKERTAYFDARTKYI